jgi:hypothetical protein
LAWLLCGIALFAYGFFIFNKIDLTVADLGRHLKNGELFVQHLQILKTNFYSYTHPEFAAANHHWGGGVVFYVVWSLFGFEGLSYFFLGLSLLTFILFYQQAERPSSSVFVFCAALMAIPLIAERREIRPEAFSYLFCAMYWFVLAHAKKISAWVMAGLAALQIVWVNCHIYFFMGPVLIGIVWLDEFSREGWAGSSKRWGLFLLGMIFVNLVNPFGLEGALAPFKIFENYGYRVLENQSIWFLMRLIQNPNLTHFQILFGILVLSWSVFGYRVWKKKIASEQTVLVLRYLLLSVVISGMGWLAFRNVALFGLFCISILAFLWQRIFLTQLSVLHRFYVWGLVTGLISLGGYELHAQRIQQLSSVRGTGLFPNVLGALQFFNQHQLKGPIFNNYDIGGYLIFGLPESEKVFVDNRPEAYPAAFFEKEYVPMQQDNALWNEQLKRYQFNVIFFSHRDFTSSDVDRI